MSGLRLAALYSFPPFELGFCGPEKKSAIRFFLNYFSGEENSDKKIRKILTEFKGVYPYYKLIAKSNKIKDPFDEKVVKAYWIGNNLLEKVDINDLRQMIVKDFSGPRLLSKGIAFKKAQRTPESSKPHHSFHVLIIGSVTGKVILTGKLLDLCRIGWGKVMRKFQISNSKFQIVVKYQPLISGKILKLGKPIQKEIVWDKTLVPEIKIGDWVSFHWNHLIQKLKKEEVKNLKKYTKITLKELTKKGK